MPNAKEPRSQEAKHRSSWLPGFLASWRFVFLCCHASAFDVSAAWFDGAWPFRREVNVTWEADKAQGHELALAEVYTAGHHKEDGSDVRVAAEDGRQMASRVLGVGPGDQVRVVFALAKGQRRYYVYFGNANPAAKPKGTEDVNYHAGLLLEMRAFPGGPADNAAQLQGAFERSKKPIGMTMLPTLFTGKNPFGDHPNWVSRMSGSIYTPLDGEYVFAVAAKDRGALLIDGKAEVFCPHLVGDTRFNAKVNLKKGRHDLLFYHANLGGEGMISVVWKKPDGQNFELIGRDGFGSLHKAAPGPLEENRKTLTADFKAEFLGEAFFANHYAYRYRFSANVPKTQPPKYEWDLGDGQIAEGNSVEHVYLGEGVYPVKLTARIATNADIQTTKFHASRDWMAEKTLIDDPAVQSKIVESYKLDNLPPAQLPWVVLMHERANRIDAALSAGLKLATTTGGYDATLALNALVDTSREAMTVGKIEPLVKLWDSIPRDSSMQPTAGRLYASLLVWRVADFEKACAILSGQPKGKDHSVERLYAQALFLNQKAAEGKKILESLPMEGPRDRQAAISGAMARTVEYYIGQGEAEAGEDHWEKWQRQYPTDFLEGYSLLLRVKLIEVRKQPEVAAKVAEAFALAMPRSSYAPSLLDRASKLIEKSNPAKSAELRKLLKQKYPEDPLSQK